MLEDARLAGSRAIGTALTLTLALLFGCACGEAKKESASETPAERNELGAQVPQPTERAPAEDPEPPAPEQDAAPAAEPDSKAAVAAEVDRAEADKAKRDEEIEEEIVEEVAAMFAEVEPGKASEMAAGRVGDDLDSAIADIKKSDDRIAKDPGSRGRRGEGRVGTSVAEGGASAKKRSPRSSVKIGDVRVDDDTSLTPAAVRTKIQRGYLAGLKRCHEALLKTEPTADGKVRFKLSIGERGSPTRVMIKRHDFSELDECLEQTMRKWRFEVPKDEDGDPTPVGVTATLTFQVK